MPIRKASSEDIAGAEEIDAQDPFAFKKNDVFAFCTEVGAIYE